MTYEWKNKRYKGVPDFRCDKSAFRNKYELWTKEGRCLGIFEFIGGMDGHVAINSLQLNPDNVANLLGDAAINAKRVEELEGENATLREMLKLSEESKSIILSNSVKCRDDLLAELTTLKAKFTPRPMSEAPRDGTWILGLLQYKSYGCDAILIFYSGENPFDETCWSCTDCDPHGEDQFIGWLPADTFKGGGES
jgi:hypothetical protein